MSCKDMTENRGVSVSGPGRFAGGIEGSSLAPEGTGTLKRDKCLRTTRQGRDGRLPGSFSEKWLNFATACEREQTCSFS